MEEVRYVELTDGRILARPYRADDVPLLVEAVQASVAEVSRWLPWCRPDYDDDSAARFIANRSAAWAEGREFSFALFEPTHGVMIGGCGLNHLNRTHHFANLWYWVRTGYAGRGVATGATRLVARFGFEVLGLQRVEVVVDVANDASQRVAEKAGAVREGVLRRRLAVGGAPRDAVMYSLVPGEV